MHNIHHGFDLIFCSFVVLRINVHGYHEAISQAAVIKILSTNTCYANTSNKDFGMIYITKRWFCSQECTFFMWPRGKYDVELNFLYCLSKWLP